MLLCWRQQSCASIRVRARWIYGYPAARSRAVGPGARGACQDGTRARAPHRDYWSHGIILQQLPSLQTIQARIAEGARARIAVWLPRVAARGTRRAAGGRGELLRLNLGE